MAKLRDVLFVAVHGEGDDKFLIAQELAVDAIEDDGPTVVGTYKLSGTRTLLKGLMEAKKSRKGKS